MVASSAGAMLPVMLAVPWPPRLMVGTTRPRLGLSQHITDDVRLAGEHLRDLADARGRFLVHHVVRVLEDAQQMVPVQVALHPRRIVVDAERQVGGVRDVEEEALDVVFRRADIGRRGEDRAVGAVVLGEAHVGDGRVSVLLPVQPKKIGMRAVFIFAVSTMIFFFSSGESIEVSPVEPMIRTADVPWSSWNLSSVRNAAKSTEPSLLNGVIRATNEPVSFLSDISVSEFSPFVMAGLVRAIHVFGASSDPGTRPGMTTGYCANHITATAPSQPPPAPAA